ncbi:unnamed protein product, partial [Coccothraustes coccothraustes]
LIQSLPPMNTPSPMAGTCRGLQDISFFFFITKPRHSFQEASGWDLQEGLSHGTQKH